MNGRRHILLDLDDTLYTCRPGEKAGAIATVAAVASELSLDAARVEDAWARARRAVKERIDGRGSSHSRLLYIAELVHLLGRPDALGKVRSWERTYWRAFLGAASLRPRVVPFLEAVRAAGGKIAIVSDLTLEVQLLKLEELALLPYLDALVTSEEVPLDKPDEAMFRLAFARLGTSPEACVMVGDREDKDGEGARRVGVPYFRIPPDDHAGESFDELARALGVVGVAS